MNCPRCGAPNPEEQKFCGSCGALLHQPEPNQSYHHSDWEANTTTPPSKTPFYKKAWFIILACIFFPVIGIILLWVTKKPKNTIVRIIVTIFLSLYAFVELGMFSSDSQNSTGTSVTSSKNDATVNGENSEAETSVEISPDEYKAECQEVNYNDVMRNPEQFVGQKMKITVQIFSASEKISSGPYYKAYTDNGSGTYFDKMVWIFDKRNKSDDGYVKILEKDIVTFYGEFNGLQETKNALNGEKGEDFALDAKYADIIEEAQ